MSNDQPTYKWCDVSVKAVFKKTSSNVRTVLFEDSDMPTCMDAMFGQMP